MGASESQPAAAAQPQPAEAPKQQKWDEMKDETFKEEVRKSAQGFKNLVQRNKVMIFSATYCSYCTVAKKTLEDLGTQFQSYEVNKEGQEGEMMMNIVQAVTGNRMVPAIFICGQIVPGGGSGLKHLATSGQLGEILGQCCEGDQTCSQYDKYSLH
eukprot:GFUD01023214.1.p2 GENE.GFUD01023214.1~~GFUD01023214.1.p2  ORF type:complete len:156 (+),score=61.23 GFUD01023214.1:52-519(+)